MMTHVPCLSPLRPNPSQPTYSLTDDLQLSWAKLTTKQITITMIIIITSAVMAPGCFARSEAVSVLMGMALVVMLFRTPTQKPPTNHREASTVALENAGSVKRYATLQNTYPTNNVGRNVPNA